MPQSIAAYQAKLAERLREALGSADDDRVRTELAVFAAKVDVDEELTRLRAHLDEVERILKQAAQPASASTSSCRSSIARRTRSARSRPARRSRDCALELKLLIEQMREQVQNIE